MENVKWLDIVIDYGKRCPNVTVKDLGLDTFCGNYEKISEMNFNVWKEGFSELVSSEDYSVFETLECGDNGYLIYYDEDCHWKPLPQNILLRLLTEGKEDLV